MDNQSLSEMSNGITGAFPSFAQIQMRYPISNRTSSARHPSRTQIQENPMQSAHVNGSNTPINNAYNSQFSTLSSSSGPALLPVKKPPMVLLNNIKKVKTLSDIFIYYETLYPKEFIQYLK